MAFCQKPLSSEQRTKDPMETEMELPESETRSSKKIISRFKSFDFSGGCKDRSSRGLGSLVEISDAFTRCHDCSSEKEASGKRQRLINQSLRLEASNGNKQVDDSRTNRAAKALSVNQLQKGKKVLYVSEIEQIKKRLQILEEENGDVKQAFFEAVEERNELVNDIYEQFQAINRFLHLQDSGEILIDLVWQSSCS